MALREKEEVSGEMGMQSMTDIIFILLMFFMMTSTIVQPSSLNLQLPGNGKTSKKPINKDKLDQVAISAQGTYELNDKIVNIEAYKSFLLKSKERFSNYKIVVAPDNLATVDKVVAILDVAEQIGVGVILAADTDIK